MRRRDFMLSVGLALAGGRLVHSGQLPQEFVNVYRPALERLRQAYGKVSVEGTLRVTLPQEDKSSEQAFIFRADGKKRRLDVRTLAQQGMGLKVGASVMTMATPYGSLNTETGPKSKFFDNAQQRNYSGVVAEIDQQSLLNYPYALDYPSTILDMLQSTAVKVASVKWIRSQGQAMVQVDYSENGRHAGYSGNWSSTLVLAPTDGWALSSFSRNLSGGSDRVSQRGELQYSGGHEGVPLVQSIFVETSRGNRVVRRDGVSVTNISFGSPDPVYFDSFTF